MMIMMMMMVNYVDTASNYNYDSLIRLLQSPYLAKNRYRPEGRFCTTLMTRTSRATPG